MNIKLYYASGTRAVRVRWLLEELGLSYELVNIDLFKGEGNTESYKKIHPLGCVPALEVDGEVIFESGAICDWLTEMVPDKKLSPEISSKQRIKYKQWFYFILATMEPHAWTIVLNKYILPENKRQSGAIEVAEHNYNQTLSVIENELKDKKYLLGNEFTTVDILLTTLLLWLPMQVKPFENTYEYMKKMRSRESYKLII